MVEEDIVLLQEELAAALEQDLEIGVEVLRKFRDRGATAEAARHALERLRRSVDSETKEDRVLELLDVVTGHCSPHLQVW